MSIVITFCLRDGIIMGADRRLTLCKEYTDGRIDETYNDETSKIYSLTDRNIGISWCGDYKVGDLEIPEFIEYFKNIIKPEDSICEIANKLNEECIGKYRRDIKWQVGGYVKGEQYLYDIRNDKVIRKNIDNIGTLGMCYVLGGETRKSIEILKSDSPIQVNNKILHSSNLPSMSIQDGIMFIASLINLTCVEEKGCDGDIDILVLNPDKVLSMRFKRN